jgi:hypothetical protein
MKKKQGNSLYGFLYCQKVLNPLIFSTSAANFQIVEGGGGGKEQLSFGHAFITLTMTFSPAYPFYEIGQVGR